MPPRDIVNIQDAQDRLSTQLLTMRSEITDVFVKTKESVDRLAEGAARVNTEAQRMQDQADRIEDLLRRLVQVLGAMVVLMVIGILGVLV